MNDMKTLCLIALLFLTGCGNYYSLDEKRGPDPEGFVTHNRLALPPDYLLRAPEPAAQTPEQPATPAAETAPETVPETALEMEE